MNKRKKSDAPVKDQSSNYQKSHLGRYGESQYKNNASPNSASPSFHNKGNTQNKVEERKKYIFEQASWNAKLKGEEAKTYSQL